MDRARSRAILFDLHAGAFRANEQPLKMKTGQRIVGMQANQRVRQPAEAMADYAIANPPYELRASAGP